MIQINYELPPKFKRVSNLISPISCPSIEESKIFMNEDFERATHLRKR